MTFVIYFQHGPFNERRLLFHQCDGGFFIDFVAAFFGQFSPALATPVQNRFPALLLNPVLDQFVAQTVFSKIMKMVVNILFGKPSAGLPNCIAVANSV